MLSRRGFLNSTLAAGVALATQGSQRTEAQVPAAQPARRRTIVDAQVHLWRGETPDRPWPPGAVAHLPEPLTVEKFLPMMDDAGVDRVVIVPPGWEGGRNEYALDAVQRHPDRFAVMGRIALDNPRSRALIASWKDQPGMLGIRLTFGQGDWLRDGTADWFWPAAEKAGLPVMFLAAGSLPAFSGIAERHPQLPLIIDHLGLSLDIAAANTRSAGIDQAVALAKYPNVSIKLSNVPTYSYEPYPFRDMTPFVRRLYDAYGPQRCYWGTDLTNLFSKATYRQRVTYFTEELNFLSEDDKDWIMGRAILARLKWA